MCRMRIIWCETHPGVKSASFGTRIPMSHIKGAELSLQYVISRRIIIVICWLSQSRDFQSNCTLLKLTAMTDVFGQWNRNAVHNVNEWYMKPLCGCSWLHHVILTVRLDLVFHVLKASLIGFYMHWRRLCFLCGHFHIYTAPIGERVIHLCAFSCFIFTPEWKFPILKLISIHRFGTSAILWRFHLNTGAIKDQWHDVNCATLWMVPQFICMHNNSARLLSQSFAGNSKVLLP